MDAPTALAAPAPAPAPAPAQSGGEVKSYRNVYEWGASLRYSTDPQGNEEILDGNDALVSTTIDRRDMLKAVDDLLLKPGMVVLEIGYGLGVAAEEIQKHHPSSHVILESSPVVLAKLREWAKDKTSVTIVEGPWQVVLPTLGKFDRIFFDAVSGRQGDELQWLEMEHCPNSLYRACYKAIQIGDEDATPYSAFCAAARRWHLEPEGRISSGMLSEFLQWADSFFFSEDRDGKEQLLDVNGAQVMMEWEKPYMQECVDELHIDETCDVLEVGFGCGYSANHIQKAGPRSHTIIECSENVLQRLRVWAADKPSVRIVEGTWQAKLPELGIFDCIFFDDYGLPGCASREMERCPNHEYVETYNEAMEEEGGTHFEGFVNIALKWHCKPGSRITGFMMHELPDEACEEAGAEVKYRYVNVQPPEHCNYFFSQRAVVPLFVKLAKTLESDSELERSSSAGSSALRVEEDVHSEDNVPSPARSRSRSRSPHLHCRGSRTEVASALAPLPFVSTQ